MSVRVPTDDFDRDVWSVLGSPVDAVDLDGAAARIRDAVDTRRRLSFVTPNVNWFVRALRDQSARRQIVDADLSLVDGAPLVKLARGLGAPLPERVAGSDLIDRLRQGARNGPALRVFFFGGQDRSAERAVERLNADGGPLVACGGLNPGYGDVASMSGEDTIAAINTARPDFVIVSLGAAKGQDWISRNQDRLEAPVIAHLGAVVDFLAGTVLRAPSWMADAGFEWLWRIKVDPALWRRYGSDGLALSGYVAKHYQAQRAELEALKPLERPAEAIPAGPGGARLRLLGDAVYGGLDPVRAAFRRAAAGQGDVILDVTGAGRIDAALLGQALMLDKAVRARGAHLSFYGAAGPIAAILRRDGHNLSGPPRARAPGASSSPSLAVTKMQGA